MTAEVQVSPKLLAQRNQLLHEVMQLRSQVMDLEIIVDSLLPDEDDTDADE